MAGGIALLAVLLFCLPPLVAIPLHGVMQLVSNGSRVVAQRQHARFDWIGWFALPLLPAGLRRAPGRAGAARGGARGRDRRLRAARDLAAEADAPRGAAGARAAARCASSRWAAAPGFLNMVIGATGVLIDPFFLGLGLSRQALVGTKAACQALGHLVKVGAVRRGRLRLRGARAAARARRGVRRRGHLGRKPAARQAQRGELPVALPHRAHRPGAAPGVDGSADLDRRQRRRLVGDEPPAAVRRCE